MTTTSILWTQTLLLTFTFKFPCRCSGLISNQSFLSLNQHFVPPYFPNLLFLIYFFTFINYKIFWVSNLEAFLDSSFISSKYIFYCIPPWWYVYFKPSIFYYNWAVGSLLTSFSTSSFIFLQFLLQPTARESLWIAN